MKWRICGCFALAVLAGLIANSDVSAKQGQERFAVATIRNNTNGGMTFYRKWVWNHGKSNEKVQIDWRVTVIPPGKSYAVHYTYQDAAKSSPDLIVVFDSDRNAGAHWQMVKLARAASTDKTGGFVYALELDPGQKEFASLNAKNKGTVTVLDRKTTRPANADSVPFPK